MAHVFRAQILGTLFGGAEEFSMTIHLADTAQSGPLGSAAEGDFTTVSNEFMAGQIYEAIRDNVFTDPNGYISQYHRLTAVKFNEINSNGRYANPNESFGYYSPSPAAGNNTLVTMPPQVAVATTFHTALVRGRGTRGRIYWPASPSVGSDGRINAGQAGSFAGIVADAITEINAIDRFLYDPEENLDGPLRCVVWSRRRELLGVPTGVDAWNEITAVSTGRVFDTQRSRRAQLPEERPAPVTV